MTCGRDVGVCTRNLTLTFDSNMALTFSGEPLSGGGEITAAYERGLTLTNQKWR